MKRKSKDIIVYNTLPDPVKSIKEYEYDSSIGKPRLVKQTLYKYNDNYQLVDDYFDSFYFENLVFILIVSDLFRL